MQPFEYPSVRYWSKEIDGALPGGRKTKFFNSRRRGRRRHRPAAPAESCQSLPKRSPWGRLGSVLYTCKRLHRMRRRFQHISANSLSSAAHKTMNSLDGFRGSRTVASWRKRCRRLPTTRPTPRGHQEPICPRKKCAIWARWRPVPGKNVNYPRAPRNRTTGLFGPHTTPTIVNYEYMPSTL